MAGDGIDPEGAALRQRMLELAVCAVPGVPPAEVLGVARLFEAYVTGARPAVAAGAATADRHAVAFRPDGTPLRPTDGPADFPPPRQAVPAPDAAPAPDSAPTKAAKRKRPPAMSAARRRVLDALTAAAAAGEPCPSNEALAAPLGVDTSTVSGHIVRLVHAGVIEVEKGFQGRRRVTIVATGARTAPPPVPMRKGQPSQLLDTEARERAFARLARGDSLAAVAAAFGVTPAQMDKQRTNHRALWDRVSVAASRGAVDAAVAAGKVTKCPPAYAAPVQGGKPLSVPVYAPEGGEHWKSQRDRSGRRTPPEAVS